MSIPLFASVDIGTQSSLLLIAKQQNHQLVPVIQKTACPRLGKGLEDSGKVEDESIQSLMASLLEFRQTIRRTGARLCGVVATHALRTAQNGKEIQQKVSEFFDSDCEILNTNRESKLSLISLQKAYPQKSVIMVDIGGGSTELAWEEQFVSLPHGAVSLYEKNGPYPDPLNRKDAREVFAGIKVPDKEEFEIFAVGGTAISFAMMELELNQYDAEKLEGKPFRTEQLASRIQSLADLSSELRSHVPGLDSSRSDIIVPGLCLLEAFLEKCSTIRFQVSGYGLRYGVIWEWMENRKIPCE